MNFTFLPSSRVLIHSSSGTFVSLSGEIRVRRQYTLFGSSETTPLISSQRRGRLCLLLCTWDTQILPEEMAVRQELYFSSGGKHFRSSDRAGNAIEELDANGRGSSA